MNGTTQAPIYWLILTLKCCNFDDIFITGWTENCQNHNYKWSQWQNFYQNDIIFVLVTVTYNLMSKRIVLLHRIPTSKGSDQCSTKQYISRYLRENVRPCSYIMTNWVESEWDTVYQSVTPRGLFARVLCDIISGLVQGLRPANERRRYKVTPSLIGWVQT